MAANLVAGEENCQVKGYISYLSGRIILGENIEKNRQYNTQSGKPADVFREKFQNHHTKNRQDKIYFQVPETTHNDRKRITVGVRMKVPVAEILPLRLQGNAGRDIFGSKSGVKLLQPIYREKKESENLEKPIQEKKKRHKNHIGDLKFQQPVKCFLNIVSGSNTTQCIEQGDIKNQRKRPDFWFDIKLARPESCVNEYDRERGDAFGKINIEISFHVMDVPSKVRKFHVFLTGFKIMLNFLIYY